MLIDLTIEVDPATMVDDHPLRTLGHVGTHFDVMEGQFPLENVRRTARIVDVSHVRGREVEISDLPFEPQAGEFIIFHTGYMREVGYSGKGYNLRSAELSDALVDRLIDQKVALIGVDAAGAQKPTKHVKVDHHCADHGVFIIENLNNVDQLLEVAADRAFEIFCLPLNYKGLTGLPCRVVAEV